MDLCDHQHTAHVGYTHHGTMIPAATYWVSAEIGPGGLDAEKLRSILTIATRHDCEGHLIGSGLRLLPKR